MTKILAISGSYRRGGIVDQAVEVAARAAGRAGASVEIVHLRDVPIAFCRNCRECTQAPGDAPGRCVQDDAMTGLVERIEAADAYILASPTNFFSVTAIFKRFMERLVVYAYWPWDARGPQYRKPPVKRAIVISSSAAPSPMARLFYATAKRLRMTARTIGAKPVGGVIVGLAARGPDERLGDADARRIERLAARLAG